MKKILSVVLVMSLLCGCVPAVRPATDFRPIIDTVSSRPIACQDDQCDVQGILQQDYHDCNLFAYQVNADQAAANNAVAGAVFMTILGAAFGLRGGNLAAVAAGGAVGGAVHGANVAAYANMTQYQIVQRCMAGRGWNVLN